MHETFDHAEFETVQPVRKGDLEDQLNVKKPLSRSPTKRSSYSLVSAARSLFSSYDRNAEMNNPYARARARDKQREYVEGTNPTVHVVNIEKPEKAASRISTAPHTRQPSEDSIESKTSDLSGSSTSSWNDRDLLTPVPPTPANGQASKHNSQRWVLGTSMLTSTSFSNQIRRSFLFGGTNTSNTGKDGNGAQTSKHPSMFTSARGAGPTSSPSSFPPPPPADAGSTRPSLDQANDGLKSRFSMDTVLALASVIKDDRSGARNSNSSASVLSRPPPAATTEEDRPKPKLRTMHLPRHPAVDLEVSPDPFRNGGLQHSKPF